DINDLCASFQTAVRDVLVEKSRRAMVEYMKLSPAHPAFAVAGGVAANTQLRAGLKSLCADHNITFCAPPLALCTDNAAMIAHAGLELFAMGRRDDMTLAPRPRWPLDQNQASMLGSGKKGAKA
ncbi:MAG: tRNA (adenosine(37)-N6)-threonylcarbamoyltransferase complex transferase subunit TsaD, partial [Planktomarina sp.]